jgi:hypothetical protein
MSTGTLIGYQLLLRDCGPCGTIFINVCVVAPVAMTILLRKFSLMG